jgi:glycosyltransferase involved in cell wall biosynthesis
VKVLVDHDFPFLLAHGGFQTQIEQTMTALRANGVDVEAIRWWDDSQKGDIIHFFGRPAMGYLKLARSKGIKFVYAPLLSGVGKRPGWKLAIQRFGFAMLRQVVPWTLSSRLGWEAFEQADACIACTGWEAHLMSYIFAAPKERVHVLSNGVEDVFLQSKPATRGQWLVCTATINEGKRVVEVAEAAALAQTPIWFIGKPYSQTDPYWKKFQETVQRHPKFVRYEGWVDQATVVQAYREARGFVLLSAFESLSLAALEAAACECPLLLSDLKWATYTFGQHAQYCPITSVERTAQELREFYDKAPNLKPPPRPKHWNEIGAQLKGIYEDLLRTSR